MDFSELNLHPDLKKGLDEVGYVTCTPVQELVFAHSFAGEDIYAQSQTGTGKTAAFLISIFQRIMTNEDQRTRKVLVLAPTRELAVQIEGEAERLGKYLSIRSGAFYGGVSYGPQIDMLRANVQMIIGTPGRIIDLVKQGKMLLKDVGFLVIDEADRMFDMGFIDDLRRLIRYLPPPSQRQTFLFSATLGLRVKDLAWEYMDSPKEIAIEPEHITVDLVTQELYHVGSHEKMSLLLGILEREKPESALIFCNQKYMVEELAKRLRVNGVDCEFIMGDLPQSKRLEIIDRLKAGQLKILVATDVAARGLDVEALDLVINYDLPDEAESYVHRIGRTARAGKAGKAVSFACEKFVYNLPAIEKFVGNKLPVMPFDTALLLPDKSAGMRLRGGRDYGRGGGGRYEGRGGRPGARTGGSHRERGQRASAGRPEERRRQPERQGSARGATRSERGTAGENPYARSQDERMRLYREKYGATAKAGEGQGQQQARPPRGRHQGQGPQAAASSTTPPARRTSPGDKSRSSRPATAARPATSRPSGAQAHKEPGLFNRLKNLIFGTKKK